MRNEAAGDCLGASDCIRYWLKCLNSFMMLYSLMMIKYFFDQDFSYIFY